MEGWENITKQELSDMLTKEFAGKHYDSYDADIVINRFINSLLPEEYAENTQVRSADGRSSQLFIRYKRQWLYTLTIKKIVDKDRSTSGYLGTKKYNYVSITVDDGLGTTLGEVYEAALQLLEDADARELRRESQAYGVYKSIRQTYPELDYYEVFRLLQWMVDHRYTTGEKFEDLYKKENNITG